MRKRTESHTPGRRVPLVWHVFHWAERYLAKDWPADRGLLFVRQFTAPVDTESTLYFGQLRDLRGLANDDHLYHYWKSLWEDLRAMTATQGRIHQGYLLDEHQQPLKEVQIAARLLVSLEETRRALQALSAVNLMERVLLPSFAEFKRMEVQQADEKTQDRPLGGARGRGKKRSCAQNCMSDANCPSLESAKHGPDAVENGDSGPAPGGGGTAVPGQTEVVPYKGNGLNDNGNPNQKEESANGQAERQGQAEVSQGPGQGQGPAQPCPPTTQPIKPKGAEAERGVDPARQTGVKPSPASLRGQSETLGAAVTQTIRRLSGQAQAFAEWVYAKLGLSDPPNSEEWRRQVAAIGGVWAFAEISLPPQYLEAFRAWAYGKAEYWRDHKHECESHVRKWMSDAKWKVRNTKKKLGRST